jgi:serine/threonine protein phosphatase PrpC
VSNWLHDNIGAFFRKELAEAQRAGRRPSWRRAIVETEVALYAALHHKADEVGSTAVMLVHYDGTYWLVNVGDSRAVVFTKAGRILYATSDHKPETERDHIMAAGGELKRPGGAGPLRINGDLAVGRAFGDFSLKLRDSTDPESYSPTDGPLSVRPDIRSFRLRRPAGARRAVTDDQRVYAILACDGVWDVLRNETAVNVLTQFDHPEQHCKDLVERALHDKAQQDNVSAVVIRLR